MISRRSFLLAAAADTVTVRVRIALDREVKLHDEVLRKFWNEIWPEAVGDLRRGGVQLETDTGECRVERPRWQTPFITGLLPGVINLVLTDRVPAMWDNGRGLNGVSGLYRGRALCLLSLDRAHAHHFPLLSVNTCLHELLHALLGDIFQDGSPGVWREAKEARNDWNATALWLTGSGGEVRAAARRAIMAGWISGH